MGRGSLALAAVAAAANVGCDGFRAILAARYAPQILGGRGFLP